LQPSTDQPTDHLVALGFGLWALFGLVQDKENFLVELPAMLLSNLSRSSDGCSRLLQIDSPLEGLHICRLLDRFISDQRRAATLNWIALILTNVSQVHSIISILID
jgi:hypothetical protein